MRMTSTPALLPFLLALLLSSPIAAQEAPAGAAAPTGLEAEMAQLNQTLERIAELLEAQVDAQEIDLGMKRLEMLTVRLERSERELRSLRSSRSSLETETISLEEHRAQSVLRYESEEIEISEEQRRAFFRQIDRQLARVREQLAETDRQIAELENRIATQRRDLQGWQDFVDRRLGGL